MTQRDFGDRFGFLVNEVGRLYGRRFDQIARQQLGLSRAQCRLLGVVASYPADRPPSQIELAERLELTPMGVASLCTRMEAAGWIRRQASAGDRRVNLIRLQPRANAAIDAALAIGDGLQGQALAGFAAAERKQLVALLRRARTNLGEGGGQ
jgi:DNA-binding MarR family transcriptional regulator